MGDDVEIVGRIRVMDDGTQVIERFNRAVDSAERSTKSAGASVAGLGMVFQGLGRIVDYAIGNLLAQAVSRATSSLVSLAGQAVQSYASFERLGMSLTALTARELRSGDATLNMSTALAQAGPKAQALVEWIQKLAIISPFTSEDISQAFRLSMAFGFTTDESKRLTTALVDYASATGASGEVIQRMSMSLGQMRAQGKITGLEIRELAMAGLPVKEILGKALGVTQVQLEKMITDGALPATRAIEILTNAIERDFGGAAAKQAGTFSGLITSLQDLKTVGLREFFTGTFQAIQPYLNQFVETLTKPEFMAGVRRIGMDLGKTVSDLMANLSRILQRGIAGYQKGGLGGVLDAIFPPNTAGLIRSTAATVVTLVTGLRDTLAGAFDIIATHGETVKNVLTGIAAGLAVFTTLGSLVTTIGAVTTTISSAGGVLAAIVALLGGPVTIAIAAVAVAAGALFAAWSANFAGIRDLTAGVWDAIQAVFAAFRAAFSGDWYMFGYDLGVAWSDAWNAVMTFAINIWDSILTFAAQFGNYLSSIFSSIWTAILASLRLFADNVAKVFANLVENLKSLLANPAGFTWKDLGAGVVWDIQGGAAAQAPSLIALMTSIGGQAGAGFMAGLNAATRTGGQGTYAPGPGFTAPANTYSGAGTYQPGAGFSAVTNAVNSFFGGGGGGGGGGLGGAVDTFVDKVRKVSAFKSLESFGGIVANWLGSGLLEAARQRVAWQLDDLTDKLEAAQKKLAKASGSARGAINQQVAQIKDQIKDLKDFIRTGVPLADEILQLASKLSAIGTAFAERFTKSVLDPIQASIAERKAAFDDIAKSIQDQFGMDKSELAGDYYTVQAYFRAREDGNAQLADQLRILLTVQQERNNLELDYRREQERIVTLQKQQQNIQFLQQQIELLKLVRENGLSVTGILGGLKLGLDADMPAVLDAVTRAMQALVGQAQAALGIKSPSRVFQAIGIQSMAGLAQGILDASGRPAAAAAAVASSTAITTYNYFNLGVQTMAESGSIVDQFALMRAVAGAV